MNKINLIKSTIELERDELNSLSQRIDSSFENALDLINNSNKIIFAGIGKSGHIAQKIAATFTSVGLQSMFLHPVEALHGDIAIVNKNDTVILLSKSGNTAELLDLIPILRSLDCKIISILGNTNSYLSENSDIVLDGSVSKEACPINLAPTTSTTVALAIGDALAVASMQIRGFKAQDFAKSHPSGQLGKNITIKVKDIMHKGNKIAILNEHSKIKDIIIEISDKKLGCACVLEGENFIGIITDGDIRRVLLKYDDFNNILAKDIMTKNPISINGDAFIGTALDLMEKRESQINVLPVLDENKLVGIIRIHDILGKGF